MVPNAISGYPQPTPAMGSQVLPLVPPDSVNEWRYREMQWLPGVMPFNYSSNQPLGPQPPPTEALVVWERYFE